MGKYNFDLDMEDKNPLSVIARNIIENSKVLEFGPANGRLTKYLYEHKKCIVDIVEIDKESGIDAQMYTRNSLLGKEGDIETFIWNRKLPDEEYDYIIFADVLEHLKDPQKVLRIAKNKLNHKGVIWISIPNISHNSVLINLMNDKFEYNSIGLLDNTHLRFFTRTSFLKMANDAGLCSAKEYSISNRVGENEINSKYSDIPKEVFKYMISRPEGNVYQYIYQLVPNARFISGECGRLVNYDRTSYYRLTCRFCEGLERKYDYQKEYTITYFPDENVFVVPVENLSGFAQISILNACCIVKDLKIEGRIENDWFPVNVLWNNVCFSNGATQYYTKKNPILECELSGYKELKISVKFESFDCDYFLINELINEINEKDKNAIQTEQKKQESAKTYEEIIKQKDQEFQESVKIYEEIIKQKDQEFQESVKTYETMIGQKDQEFQESVKTYEEVILQKDREFQESVKTYEKVIAHMGSGSEKI